MRESGNFWAAGPVGPCGPCSELHYDMRPDPAAPDAGPADDEDRFLEIWNLVFMQYSRDESGELTPLPAQNIDTGAGLERWAMMLQGVENLYETDLFAPLLAYVGERAGRGYEEADEQMRRAMRVVAEHGRAMTFLIADGALPSNEGRGYVLRRLIRRALYMADRLDIQDALLSDVAAQVRRSMSEWYPELTEQSALVARVLDQEDISARQPALQGLATGHHVFVFLGVFGEAIIRGLRVVSQVFQRDDFLKFEAVSQFYELFRGHFFDLVGGVAAFKAFA